ncbi:PREDICTED: uncharacterized protein LOC108751555 [Trachymyrmex septentrionalis]|uniref:uncharacterized protein LOC108751555 n=1 Tax=Trachymyrmex septentrionalis TaxID=34720 RepID=UPI00084F22C8|nr:PREDICTED: uncharacterized protein LOC108751555 [Trachymyrmex septentrionalis]
MAASLGRLTANIGGPGECRRRVYATVVMSVVLYRAPVWAQAIATDGVTRRAAARLQRQLALRIIRGYRTVSYEASLLLARLVPFDLLADRLRRSYLRRRALIERDGFVAPRAISGMMSCVTPSLDGGNGWRSFRGMHLGLRSEGLSWEG